MAEARDSAYPAAPLPPPDGSMRRGLVVVALLLGPLAAAEWWLGYGPATPRIIGAVVPYKSAADAKQLLFRARDECPEVLSLGTSMSDRTVIDRFAVGRELSPGQPVRSTFDFAIGSARPENMLAAWRWVERQG